MPRTIVYDSPAVRAEVRRTLAEPGGEPLGVVAPRKRRALRRRAEVAVAGRERAPLPATLLPSAPSPSPSDPSPGDAASGAGSRDDYFSRIAKYVPVEIITLTTLGFGAFGPSGAAVWWWVTGGALANVVYLLGVGVSGDVTQRPRWFTYVLAVPAYVLWAMATIDPVGATVGISGSAADSRKAFVLAVAAFLVPALDVLCEHLDRSVVAGAAGPAAPGGAAVVEPATPGGAFPEAATPRGAAPAPVPPGGASPEAATPGGAAPVPAGRSGPGVPARPLAPAGRGPTGR